MLLVCGEPTPQSETYAPLTALAQCANTPCPLWVKSGRDALKFRCPLYPRKRTFAHAIMMSALGHKRTHALRNFVVIRSPRRRELKVLVGFSIRVLLRSSD